ncbi:hypothetical protein ACP70R_005475 [Stipagrostis hirtigluma subsp. patula]
MDIEENIYRRVLVNRIQQLNPPNVDRIVSYVFSRKAPWEITWYAIGLDDQILNLIAEAMSFIAPPVQQFLQQTPSSGHHFQPPRCRPQYHASGSSHAIPAPIGQTGPRPWQPQLHPRLSSYGNQAPSPVLTGPLHHGLTQFHPSSSSRGVQVQSHPTGSTADFLTALRERSHSLSSADGGMPRKNRNASQNVTGGPSSSKAHIRPCQYHFGAGHCERGGNCRFSHASADYPQPPKEEPVHSLETLPKLEGEIAAILILHQRPLPVERLPKLYFEKYGMSLLADGFPPKGQEEGKDGYSLRSLLIRFNSIKVIESDGQHRVVLVEDGRELGKPADDSKLALGPPSNGPNKIFIKFCQGGRFTIKNAFDYFRKYGPVNYVQLQPGCSYGFVNFVYTETVNLILSETSPHLICGEPISINPYSYKGKHEEQLQMLKFPVAMCHNHRKSDQEDAHPNSGAHEVPAVNFTHEAHSGDNTAESSNVSNRLVEATADQDSDDIDLPDNIDIEY